MNKSMKYPLVGLNNNVDSTYGSYLQEKLKMKCMEYAKLLVNEHTNTIPEYHFLKTKNGNSFGIVVHKEQRFSKRNLFHKKGYKSNRVSYDLSELDHYYVKMELGSSVEKLNVRFFTKIEAFSLKEDCQLVPIAELYYYITEDKKCGKRAYIDGVNVDENYRGLGISRALQDYVHLCFANEHVNIIEEDLIKKDIEYASQDYDPLRSPYTPYYHMLVGIPDGKRIRGVAIPNPPTESYGYQVESLKMKNSNWCTITPVKAEMKNIKLNPEVVIPNDVFLKSQNEDIMSM